MSIRNWDDDCEDVISSVTSYDFVGDEEEPECYSVLPILWCEGQKLFNMDRKIYLKGCSSSGGHKVYKQVKAWRFDLSTFDEVKVEVLSKENKWIVLDEPRKSYEEIIRTIRLTLCCLQYLKRNPHTSGSSLLSNVSASFNMDIQSLEDDLRNHLTVIKSSVQHDNALKSCEFLLAFLKSPRKAFTEDLGAGLVTKKPKQSFDDAVCAICDNGGDVLCCDGKCKRCFHATAADADADINCESLGLSKAEIAAEKFFCPNCRYRQHQCFVCGKLGSSNCSSAQEVFSCASCAHFYHPRCVADLLCPANEVQNKHLQRNIAAGKPFTCPAHKCFACKEEENSLEHKLQFAVCRRCPKAYHRKCLPGGIRFGSAEKLGLVRRAWDNLLPRNRILLYCQDHEIEEAQGTPSRNHIVFPKVGVEAKVQSTHSGQHTVLKRKRMVPEEFQKGISVGPRNSVEKQSKFVENKLKRFSVQQLVSTKRMSTKVIPKDSIKPVMDRSYQQQRIPTRPDSTKPVRDHDYKHRQQKLPKRAISSRPDSTKPAMYKQQKVLTKSISSKPASTKPVMHHFYKQHKVPSRSIISKRDSEMGKR